MKTTEWKEKRFGGDSTGTAAGGGGTCPSLEAFCGWSVASFSTARQPCSTEAASSMWPATSLITLSQKRAWPMAACG